jgi:hypothetical protein
VIFGPLSIIIFAIAIPGVGGETGIRTLGGLAPTTVFETAPFDHSGTSPRAIGAEDPRLDLLTAFIETNDLVERNVSGALNSNFAFYRGLSEGGAFEVEIPEELMLSEVWGQEPELRRDTIEWLYSFQLSAYSGLEDADIEAYTAFSATDAGTALNAALFAAFDTVFNQLSFELGRRGGGVHRGRGRLNPSGLRQQVRAHLTGACG